MQTELEKAMRKLFRRKFPGVRIEKMVVEFTSTALGKRYLTFEILVNFETVKNFKKARRENPVCTNRFLIGMHNLVRHYFEDIHPNVYISYVTPNNEHYQLYWG